MGAAACSLLAAPKPSCKGGCTGGPSASDPRDCFPGIPTLSTLRGGNEVFKTEEELKSFLDGITLGFGDLYASKLWLEEFDHPDDLIYVPTLVHQFGVRRHHARAISEKAQEAAGK
jgi:hypothetical protein